VVGIARRDFSRLVGAWVERAFAGAPRHPAFETLRRDGVFRGAQRHTRFLVERFVLAQEAQAAAKFSRAAGVGNELEASDARGEFRFDDLDRRDARVRLIDVRARHAVFSAAAARAAAEDFVLHVAAAGLVAAAADNDRAAAAAVGDFFLRRQLAERLEQRLDERVHR